MTAIRVILVAVIVLAADVDGVAAGVAGNDDGSDDNNLDNGDDDDDDVVFHVHDEMHSFVDLFHYECGDALDY